jgi:multiple sugar transport system ATP-binding protein
MTAIAIRHVGKRYDDGTQALTGVSLEVSAGQLVVLVGPSGSGKTTLLRMVAGLESITEGLIEIDGQVINNIPAKHRDVAMVFQNYALYPHMSVYDNMAFGLRIRKLPKHEIRKTVEDAARTLGLSDHLAKKPAQLSGGQRQRVAMGRAIVRSPKVFLMDEPLSNLDAKLRIQMRTEISRVQRRLGVTTLYVTHDQIEAMTMGDLVAVMHDGRIEQIGEPQELYERPANLFVAGFIGSPAMNLVESHVERYGDSLCVDFAGIRIPLGERSHVLKSYVGRAVVVGLRPEHLMDSSRLANVADYVPFSAVVEIREVVGAEMYLHFSLNQAVFAPSPSDPNGRGTETATSVVARVDAHCKAVEGAPAFLSVDPSALRFFDPSGGAAIG